MNHFDIETHYFGFLHTDPRQVVDFEKVIRSTVPVYFDLAPTRSATCFGRVSTREQGVSFGKRPAERRRLRASRLDMDSTRFELLRLAGTSGKTRDRNQCRQTK